ncbi:glutamate racemase [bacterium]|nr:glutamate racemase [bacterium]
MTILDSNNSIGFFDSGVGGLTVLSKVKKLLPYEKFIFYGDTAHVPYGDKTKSQLLEYSDNILKFFEKKGCKAVVMACNTTSSVIFDDINGRYNFKLYPVVQSVAKVLAGFNVDRLGVFATKATIESGAYSKEIAKYNPEMKVFGQFCENWVHIVENNLQNQPESVAIVKSDLEKMLENDVQKIVLGCTHYPFLTNILSRFVPRDMFIDPADYLAEFIKNDLATCGLLSDGSSFGEEFYVSANPSQFKKSAQLFYELKAEPNLLNF